jgi:hypothetical protein
MSKNNRKLPRCHELATASAKGSTQLTQAAALRRTTAHAAAAVILWLLWRAQRNYTIMISPRAPIVLTKTIKHYISDPARIRSTLFSFCFATTSDRTRVLLASQQMEHLLQSRFHIATLPAIATHGAPACAWKSRWRVSFAATLIYLERIGAPRHERRDACC